MTESRNFPQHHGFAWAGQSWEHCESCGEPARNHPGMSMLAPGENPLDHRAKRVIVSWDEAAERMPIARAYGILSAVGESDV